MHPEDVSYLCSYCSPTQSTVILPFPMGNLLYSQMTQLGGDSKEKEKDLFR